jgi:hypothetical protein
MSTGANDTVVFHGLRDRDGNVIRAYADGLTKRELFAALALQGALASDENDACPSNTDVDVWRARRDLATTRYAVRIADALIVALNETT